MVIIIMIVIVIVTIIVVMAVADVDDTKKNNIIDNKNNNKNKNNNVRARDRHPHGPRPPKGGLGAKPRARSGNAGCAHTLDFLLTATDCGTRWSRNCQSDQVFFYRSEGPVNSGF
jgi:hypothetical protein